MDVAPATLGYLFGLMGVGAVSLIVGLRVGARVRPVAPVSQEAQLLAAISLLRRHFEERALADLEASGAKLWSPDPARIADLSFGAEGDTTVNVSGNAKVR